MGKYSFVPLAVAGLLQVSEKNAFHTQNPEIAVTNEAQGYLQRGLQGATRVKHIYQTSNTKHTHGVVCQKKRSCNYSSSLKLKNTTGQAHRASLPGVGRMSTFCSFHGNHLPSAMLLSGTASFPRSARSARCPEFSRVPGSGPSRTVTSI